MIVRCKQHMIRSFSYRVMLLVCRRVNRLVVLCDTRYCQRMLPGQATGPYVIAVAMQKGGVGKTTSAISLAFCLYMLGLRVALLDLDPQANATRGMGVEPGPNDCTLFEVLDDSASDRVALADALLNSPWGVLVGASHRVMRRLERYGLGTNGQIRFARQVRALDVDVVIIDCPPNLGELTVAALTAAHSVLATVLTGPDEIEALLELQRSVSETQEGLNPDVSIDYVIATAFDGRNTVAKDVRRSLENDWPNEYLGEVSNTVRVREAKAAQQPVVVFAPKAEVARDYERIAKAIHGRMLAHVY